MNNFLNVVILVTPLILQCKHVLAAKLSDAMGLVTVQSVTDEHMSALLKAMNWLLVNWKQCFIVQCILRPLFRASFRILLSFNFMRLSIPLSVIWTVSNLTELNTHRYWKLLETLPVSSFYLSFSIPTSGVSRNGTDGDTRLVLVIMSATESLCDRCLITSAVKQVTNIICQSRLNAKITGLKCEVVGYQFGVDLLYDIALSARCTEPSFPVVLACK